VAEESKPFVTDTLSPETEPNESDYQILRLLQDNPNLSQREIAAEVKISIGAVNYCLRALVEKGWIKINNFRSFNNRLRYAYVLTPRGLSEKSSLTRRFLQCKLTEYERIKSEIHRLKAEITDLPDLPPEASGSVSPQNHLPDRDTDTSISKDIP
jgi:EPS-associated MarR family transcriptional regulator